MFQSEDEDTEIDLEEGEILDSEETEKNETSEEVDGDSESGEVIENSENEDAEEKFENGDAEKNVESGDAEKNVKNGDAEENVENGDAGKNFENGDKQSKMETSPVIKNSLKSAPAEIQGNSLMNDEDPDEEASSEHPGEIENYKFDKRPPWRRFDPPDSSYVDPDQISEDELFANDMKNWYERDNSRSKRKKPSLDCKSHIRDSSSSSDPDAKNEKKKRKRSLRPRTKPKKLSEAKRKKMIERRKARKEPLQRPCKYYQEGHCSKGSVCQFQHVKPLKKKELCRYYIAGGCKKIKTCPFMHNDFPCKFYHTGAECYCGNECRYSHKPLTEEMKKILHNYLKFHHGENFLYHNQLEEKACKQESAERLKPLPPPPFPLKKASLLGSPPKHIKFSVETRQWQREMMHLQMKQKIDAFKIDPSFTPQPSTESPMSYTSSNFYVDTLECPSKNSIYSDSKQPNVEFKNLNFNPFSFRNPDSRRNSNFNPFSNPNENRRSNGNNIKWQSISKMIDDIEDPQMDFDTAATTEHTSNGENNSINQAVFETAKYAIENDDRNNIVTNENKDERSEITLPQKLIKQPQDELMNDISPIVELPDPDPIVIPTHLPKMQKKLLLRIQTHQKLTATETVDTKTIEEEMVSESSFTSGPNNVQDKVKVMNECEESLDSSDDEVEDEPLTILLRKINQTPLPKPEKTPVEMLPFKPMCDNTISNGNKTCSINQLQGQDNKFWQDMLNTAQPVKTEPMFPEVMQYPDVPKSSASLKPHVVSANLKTVATDRDPRLLKNGGSWTIPSVNAAPKFFAPLKTEISNNVPLPLNAAASTRVVHPHHNTLNILTPIQNVNDAKKCDRPELYKLHTVSAKPLNYASYIPKGHSDSRLFSDPRLRKFLAPEQASEQTTNLIKPVPEANIQVPDIPSCNTFKIEKPNATPLSMHELFTDAATPSSEKSNDLQVNEVEPCELLIKSHEQSHLSAEFPKQQRSSFQSTDQENSSTQLPKQSSSLFQSSKHQPENIAPHSVIQSPSKLKSKTPAPTSHLPRSIIDPRMVSLMGRLSDPRRTRAVSKPGSSMLKKSPELKMTTPLDAGIKTVNLQSHEIEMKSENKNVEGVKTTVGEEIKSKKTATCRNSKTGMDYVSPLQACNGRANKNLNFNDYNKRPKKPPVPLPSESLVSSSGNPVVQNFASGDNFSFVNDSKNETSSSSLKDVFQTKDPTASPFC